MSIQLVIFELDDIEYGIDVTTVNGILSAKKFNIMNLPGSDKSIEGMINLRGNVNYIFNLRNKFQLIEKEICEESKFIMLNVSDSSFGCIVDEVTDIIKLKDEEVELAPNFSNKNNFISGIGKLGDRMIIILDPVKIFSTEFAFLQGTL